MPEQTDLVARLTEYIVDEVASRRPEAPVTPDFPIIEGGLVDSLGLFKLIAFVEEQYSVSILPEEILFENFATINEIKRLIEAKLPAGPAANATQKPR